MMISVMIVLAEVRRVSPALVNLSRLISSTAISCLDRFIHDIQQSYITSLLEVRLDLSLQLATWSTESLEEDTRHSVG
jgi:hypothetical protein